MFAAMAYTNDGKPVAHLLLIFLLTQKMSMYFF